MRIRITKKARIIIGVVVGILVFTIGAMVSHRLAEQTAQKQAVIQEQMRLAEERALEYDYDMAIALLEELPNSDTNPKVQEAIENYKMLKLKHDLDVYLVSATTSEMEPDSDVNETKFIWECAIGNYTDKTIKSLELVLIFKDTNEKPIKRVQCKFSGDVVRDGEKTSEVFSIEIGKEDTMLLTLLPEEVFLDYYIRSIEYEDGTKEEFSVYKGNAEKAHIENDK